MKTLTAVIAVMVLSALAGCGADGEPVTPSMNTSVTIGTGGISTSTSVGLSQGPFTLGVSL